MFRFKGLDHVDEMRALFEGISATGKGAWGPSREVCLDEIGSSTNQQDKSTNQQDKSPMDVSVDSDSARPSSSKNSEKRNEKQRKRSKGLEEENEIQAILKALARTDGPSIEECNQVLDEMASIDMHDPMYSIASVIFCENASIRKQWMNFAKKPEEVRITWLKLTAKKLGLM